VARNRFAAIRRSKTNMSRPFRAGDGVVSSFPGLQPRLVCLAPSGLGIWRGIVLPGPSARAGMSRPFRAGDMAWHRPSRAFSPGWYVSPLQGWGYGVASSFPGLQPGLVCLAPSGLGIWRGIVLPGPSARAGMSRPFRAGDSAFEKGLKGPDIPAQAEGLGRIPAKRNLSPEGAQHKLVCPCT